MEKYIALLRGINVSGSKSIAMNDLKLSMAELNFIHVESYIQSGNLLFEYAPANPYDLAELITLKIQKTFGFQVPVIVKTAQEWLFVLAHNSMIPLRNEAIDKLHVTFFSAEPTQAMQGKLNGIDSGSDEFILAGNMAYLYCPNGYGRTKLNNSFFEQKLNVSATTRNWKTIVRLAEMLGAR